MSDAMRGGERLALRRLLRSAAGLSVASIVSPALAVPAGFLAARWLGPNDYGRAQSVLLVYMLATLVRSGAFEGGIRLLVHHSAMGDKEAAQRAQNVGITVETAVSAVAGLVVVLGLFVVHDPLRRVGFVLAPLAIVASSYNGYLSALYAARERFNIVARVALLRGLSSPVVLLLAVRPLGGLAIVVAPLVADVMAIAGFRLVRQRLRVKFDFDARIGRHLVRTGLPLGLAAIVYWGYRLVGSASVGIARSASEYGVYAFAAAPITIIARAVASMHTVLMPAVWGEMAADEGERRWGLGAGRATIAIAVAAGAATSLGQALFSPVVSVVAPAFVSSAQVFEILGLNVLLLSVGGVPSLVLDSTVVNQQVRHLLLWLAALLLNIVANFVTLRRGGGLIGVAINDVWVQALVVVCLFRMAGGHLPADWPRHRVHQAIVGAAAVTAVVMGLLRLIAPRPATPSALAASIAVRLLIVVVCWVPVALLVLRARHAATAGFEPA